MKLFGILLVSLVSFSALAATSDELEQLKKRVEELEKRQDTLYQNSGEPRPSVNSFVSDNLTLGGFFDGGLSALAGPDTKTQVASSYSVLGINAAADLGNKYRFVAQYINLLTIPLSNRHNDPTQTPKSRQYNQFSSSSVLTQGYLEYTKNRLFNFQFGQGFVPFGFALQLREPVLYVRRLGPQIVKEPLVSQLWTGAHIYGSKQLKNNSVGYDVYTFTPQDNKKFLGAGGRAWISTDDDKIIGGVSTQVAKNDDEVYETVGADLRFDYFPYQVRSEFIQVIRKGEDTWSSYVEPGYYIYGEELMLYAFGDYIYDAQNISANGVPDPFQKWEYGFGLNWLPVSFTRIRLGVTFSDYVGKTSRPLGQDRDFTRLDLSVGVAF